MKGWGIIIQYDVNYFITKQKEGQIFAKMSKEPGELGEGGSHLYGYNELSIRKDQCDLSFTFLETALRYMPQYGSKLTIIDFSENDSEIKQAKIRSMEGKTFENCFKTDMYRTKWARSVNTKETIDFIFDHIKNHEIFTYTLINWENPIYNNDKGFYGEAADYFSFKAGNYLQKCPIPQEMTSLPLFFLTYDDIYKLIRLLQHKGICLYKKNINYNLYEQINDENIHNIINKRFSEEENFKLFFESKYFNRVYKSVLKIHEPSFWRRTLGRKEMDLMLGL